MVVELTQTEQKEYLRNTDKAKQTLPTYVGTKKRKVWILEGGYCSDTNCKHKYKEKTEQHQVLVNMLTTYGYQVMLRPMPLGYAGSIYQINLEALLDVGITKHQALRTPRELQSNVFIASLNNEGILIDSANTRTTDVL